LPVGHASLGRYHVYGRRDLNRLVETISTLPENVAALTRGDRAVALADALRGYGRQKVGDTTNVSVVDAEGNACVITTTLGIGSGVWLPGHGVHLNSMLGEGELITDDLTPGRRMSSMMCPLVVVDEDGGLVLAAGSAGASRIRSALMHTLVGALLDGEPVREAVHKARFHVVDDVVHTEPGYPEEELTAVGKAGYQVNRWDHLSHYFGGVSAVGVAGAAGDPRRGGAGQLL
jgi:gamma-glutamyltranspeptidase / glutathione hydrolase